MPRRPSLTAVEDRVRATLLERSRDCDSPTSAAAGAAAPAADAPAPPGNAHRRRLAAAAAVAVVAVATVGVLVAVRDRGSSEVVAADETEPLPDQTPGPQTQDSVPPTLTCSSELPVLVTVPAATSGPVAGPAPGGAPAAEGQLVVHWPGANGGVEARWPAPTQAVYGTGRPAPTGDTVSTSAAGDRLEIDVHPVIPADGPGLFFAPDLVVERPAGAGPDAAPAAPCDVVELAVIGEAGRWSTGLRLTDPTIGFSMEMVDLTPRIIETRQVEAAPTTAIPCQGADQNGTPPNRSGGADPSMRGATPADVLVQYLTTTPYISTSGYVEMIEPDGSVTYGVDASGAGWTTLVFVDQDADGWLLGGDTMSGC